MTRRVQFNIGDRVFPAVLAETRVADAIWEALPVGSRFSTWGEEIYFDCGLSIHPESDQATVEVGDVAYWPPGSAICLFWGPTPVSVPGEIRPASPVAVFARLEGDPKELAAVTSPHVTLVRLDD